MEKTLYQRTLAVCNLVLTLAAAGCAGSGSSSNQTFSLILNSTPSVENVNSNSVSLSWYSSAPGATARGASALTQFTVNDASALSFAATIGASSASPTLGTFYSQTLGGLTSGVPNWFTLQLMGDQSTSPYMDVMSVTPGFGMAGWFGAGHDGWQPISNNRQFMPHNIRLMPSGQLLVVDGYGSRVIRMSVDGEFLGWIGSGKTGWQMGGLSAPGKGDGQFSFPTDVAWDTSGNLYVSDMGNNRVQKWSATGTFVGWIGGGASGWQTGAAPVAGNSNAQFNGPGAITLDASGNLWIADVSNARFQKWTAAGTYVGWIGNGVNGIQTGVAAGGAGNAQFSFPYGISFDASGNAYMAECGNNRVQKWDSSLNYVGWIGGGANGWQTGAAPAYANTDKSFNCVYNVLAAADGNLYITDNGGSLQKWTYAGVFQGKFGNGSEGWNTGLPAFVQGQGDKFLNEPSGTAIDPATGNIYVADSCNGRIVVLNASGAYKGWYGLGLAGIQTGIANSILDYSGEPRSLSYPIGITIDSAGTFLIPDLFNHKVTKWNSAGIYQGAIGNGVDGWNISTTFLSGTGDKLMNRPASAAVDAAGNVYVSDSVNARVQKWSAAGTYIGWLGGGTTGWHTGAAPAAGAGDSSFNTPGVLLVSGNFLYVADRANHRIQKWNITAGAGTYVGWIGGGTSGWKTGAAPAPAATDASFNSIGGMDIDSGGNLYAIDIGGNRIQKWLLLTGAYGGWIGGADGWQTGTAPASGSADRSFSFSGSSSSVAISQVGGIL